MGTAKTQVLGDPFAPQRLKMLPDGPGVYLMRDPAGRVLYVGKAKNIRKRVSSYRRAGTQGKTAALLRNVALVEAILTRSEKEALILEATLIKKHTPRYNVVLRDDKNYPLLKLTVAEEWPRLLVVRRRGGDTARYFGPFSSPGAMRETLRHLNHLFPLRKCKERRLKKRERGCLNLQIGRCLGPCIGMVSRAEYARLVEGVIRFLSGRGQELVSEIAAKMRSAASAHRFEEAAVYRDQMRALEKTLEQQLVVASHRKDQDVFGVAEDERRIAVAVLLVRGGVLTGREVFVLSRSVDDTTFLGEVLRRFYERREVPAEILLPGAVDDATTLSEWLSERRRCRVRLLVPRRGRNRELVQMAVANALQELAEAGNRHQGWEELSRKMKNELHLSVIPNKIECVDISNLGGGHAFGAIAAFTEGEKDSSHFRRYRVREVETIDDYLMMQEVLFRRLSRGIREGDLPDLLVVDGGKGQLQVAARVVAELGIEGAVELAAIAKDRGEGERVFRPGRKNPLPLAHHSPVLLLLMRIRDEAHRFGVAAHRRARARDTLESALDRVPGVGAAKKQALLNHLGSVERIRRADPAEIAVVPGIGKIMAQRILRFLQEDGRE